MNVIKVLLLMILLSNVASGYVTEFKWQDASTHTLMWGDRIAVAGHEIEFWDFSGDVIVLNVYYNGSFYEEVFLSGNGGWNSTWVHDDIFKIQLNSMDSDEEKALITTFIGKMVEIDVEPKLEVSISSDYAPAGSSFMVLANIKSINDQPFENISVKLDSGEFDVIERDVRSHFNYLVANGSLKVAYNLRAPQLLENTVFTINVTVSGWDNKSYHEAVGYENITVRSVELTKQVYPMYLVLNSDRRNATVLITLKNPTSNTVSAYIEDEIPQGFDPVAESQMKTWFVTLPPDSSKSVQYQATANKYGNVTFPKARAWLTLYDEHTLITSKPAYPNNSVQVHGSAVILEKRVDGTLRRVGDHAKVSIIVRNIGDKTAFVKVNDTVSKSVKVVSGDTRWNGILQHMQFYEYSYKVRLIQYVDKLILPNATVSFVDSKKNEGSSVSNEVVLVIAEKSEGETVIETINDTSSAIDNDPYIVKTGVSDNVSMQINNTSGNNQSTLDGWDIAVKHVPGFDAVIMLISFAAVMYRRKK